MNIVRIHITVTRVVFKKLPIQISERVIVTYKIV